MSSCTEWLWARNVGGYGLLSYKNKTVQAHRLAYCQANGLSLELIQDKQVLHKCDNRGCVNPDHLFLGTHATNMRDKALKGRAPRGVDHWNSKLTEDDVKGIRDSCISNRATARNFGISERQVRRIKSKGNWKE